METGTVESAEKEPKIFTSPAEFYNNYQQSEFFQKEYQGFLNSERVKKGPPMNEGQLLYTYLNSDEAEHDIVRYADTNNITIKIYPTENQELYDAVKDYTDTIKDKKKAEVNGDRPLITHLDEMQRNYHNTAGEVVTRQLHKDGIVSSTQELYNDPKDEASFPRGLGRGVVLVIAGRAKRS